MYSRAITVRILLDSRDLINVTQNGRGATVPELDAYLRAGNHELVLCFSTIRELCGPIGAGRSFLEVRSLLQSLETLPVVYLREVSILGIELEAAVNAFVAGTVYRDPEPYVRRWDHTLMSRPGERQPQEDDVVGLRLDDLVFLIKLTRPDIFAPPQQHLPTLQTIIANGRTQLRAGQAPAERHFISSLQRHAATHRVELPQGREDEFARWVYSNPNRCPGARLNHEILRSITQNYGDRPEVGDFTDLALTMAIPYVDCATLDARMRGYCAQASEKMLRFGAANDYAARVYEDVADIIRRV